MHKVCGLAAVVSLLASPVAWAGPLPAGKVAGVRQAQLSADTLILAGGMAALTIAGIAVAVSGGDSTQNQITTTTTTSSTATSS